MSLIPTGHSSSTRSGSATLRVLGVGAGALFLTSAALSLWAAHDRSAAMPALAAIGGGLLLAALFVVSARRNTAPVAVLGFLALAAAATLQQLHLLGRIADGAAVQSTVALLLPLGVATAFWCFSVEQKLAGWATLLVVLACLALFMLDGERSPRGALLVGGLLAGLTATLLQPGRSWFWRVLLGLGVLALGAAAAAYGTLILRPALLPASIAQVAPVLAERAELWNQALPLLRDYPYIGSGLANTSMVHASYALLSHVSFLEHVRNLYLQIAVEMGLIGLLAFVALLGSAILATLFVAASDVEKPRFMATALLASLFTLALLGLVDSEWSLTPYQMVVFIPMAAAWSLHRGLLGTLFEHSESRRQRLAGSLVGITALVAIVAAPILTFGASAAYSNSAALRQQRIELAVYNQETWQFQDRVRREYAPALAPVMAEYERAIALDPNNASARRRLAQIQLSLGQNEAALSNLLAASAGDRSLPTMVLLGEALALSGDADRAAAIWADTDAAQDQLWLRWAWHDAIGDSEGAALLEEAGASVEPSIVGSAP